MSQLAADADFSTILKRSLSVQKSPRGVSVYSRFFNRPLGAFFAAVAHKWNMSPNQVTAISAVFTFAGIALLGVVKPAPWLGLVIGVLLVLGYALDAADGQLARLRATHSVTGEWLDHVIDAIKTASLHLVVLLSFYRFTDLDDGYLLIPLGFAIVDVVTYFGLLLNDLIRRTHGVKKDLAEGERASMKRSLIVTPADYGVLCLVFFFVGFESIFLVLYIILFVANTLYLAAGLLKWYRDMKRLDQTLHAAA